MPKIFIPGLILAILACIVFFVPEFAPPCLPDAEKPVMKCWWAFRAVQPCAAVMAVAALFAAFMPERKIQLVASFLYFLITFVIIALPTVIIGVCGVPTMPCRVLARPVLLFFAGLSACASFGISIFCLARIMRGES